MSIAQLWEHLNAIALLPRGVRSTWLTLADEQIHCLIARSHRPLSTHRSRVVCIHGLGASGAGYGKLLSRLTQTWREVWAPSAPGHGLSTLSPHHHSPTTSSPSPHQHRIYLAWERILLLLSQDEPIDLIANSLGGAISIRFAARHPERVSRLILCSPAGAQLNPVGIEHIRDVFRMSDPGDGLRFLKTLYHKAPWWSPLIAPFLQRALSAPRAQEIIRQLKPSDCLDPFEVSTLSMPTLLIWGQRERVLPSASLDYFREHAPKHFTLEQPLTFSHSPQQEHPQALAELISNWIKLHQVQ